MVKEWYKRCTYNINYYRKGYGKPTKLCHNSKYIPKPSKNPKTLFWSALRLLSVVTLTSESAAVLYSIHSITDSSYVSCVFRCGVTEPREMLRCFRITTSKRGGHKLECKLLMYWFMLRSGLTEAKNHSQKYTYIHTWHALFTERFFDWFMF